MLEDYGRISFPPTVLQEASSSLLATGAGGASSDLVIDRLLLELGANTGIEPRFSVKAKAREKELLEKARLAAAAAAAAAAAELASSSQTGSLGVGHGAAVVVKAVSRAEKKDKQYWAKGTGYGHDAALDPSVPVWDPAKYARDQVSRRECVYIYLFN